MNVGDKVKVAKLRDGWEKDFDLPGDERILTTYRSCVDKVGTVLFIESGNGFVDYLDEIELEIDGQRDLYFYADELELVVKVKTPGLESWCEGHPESPDPNRPGGYSRKLEVE